MRSKGWGFAVVTTAIVGMFCAVGPVAAYAETPASTTALYCGIANPEVGRYEVCVAVVRDAQTGAEINGGTVTLSSQSRAVDGLSCTVESHGVCEVSFTPLPEDVGPLAIRATYDGGADHLPSSGDTTIAVRELTWIVAKPAIANLVSPTKVNLTMSARLTDRLDHTPIAGETVRFAVDGTTLCTGVTDADGVATCSDPVDVVQAATGYRALFDGATYKVPASAYGAGVRI